MIDQTNPVQRLWLGKMQMELGIQLSNYLMVAAENESLTHQLTKITAENAAKDEQIKAMAETNAAQRNQIIEMQQAALKDRKRGKNTSSR